MGFENNIEMLSLAFWQVLKLAGPVLLVALAIGLVIGIIQAATSINEMTLSFVPKGGYSYFDYSSIFKLFNIRS